MAKINAQRIPFAIDHDGKRIEGEAIGSRLEAYATFEVVLNDGAIFNIQAVPQKKEYRWFGLVRQELQDSLDLIGQFIELYFNQQSAVSLRTSWTRLAF
jgi:hypothetical protein